MPRHKRIGSINTRYTAVSGDAAEGSVKLYDTIIVRWNAHNVILDHGGYASATTRDRMNATSRTFNLGFSVNIEKGAFQVWLSRTLAIPWPPDTRELVIPRAALR